MNTRRSLLLVLALVLSSFPALGDDVWGTPRFDDLYEVLWDCPAVRRNSLDVELVMVYGRKDGNSFDLPEWIMTVTTKSGVKRAGEDTEYLDDFDFQGYGSESLGFNLQTTGPNLRKYEYLIQDRTEIRVPLKCRFAGKVR